MPHNLYQVILKFGNAGDQLWHYFAYSEQAVFNEIRRMYPTKSADDILISVVEYGYETIYKNYPQYQTLNN